MFVLSVNSSRLVTSYSTHELPKWNGTQCSQLYYCFQQFTNQNPGTDNKEVHIELKKRNFNRKMTPYKLVIIESCVCVYVCMYIHCVSKNDTDVAHYNYNILEGIFIIFSRYVTKKISN